MRANPPVASAVSAIRSAWISSMVVLCAIRYAWISAVRWKDLGSAMAPSSPPASGSLKSVRGSDDLGPMTHASGVAGPAPPCPARTWRGRRCPGGRALTVSGCLFTPGDPGSAPDHADHRHQPGQPRHLAADLRPQLAQRGAAGRHPGHVGPPGRQPLDRLQLGDQRIQRRQRLLLRERRLPELLDQPRARPSGPRCRAGGGGRSRRARHHPRSSTTWPATRPRVCNVQNTPNYLALHFDQNLPTKGSAFSLNPSTTDGKVYQDEFVNWLKQAVPGAQRDDPARQRARPLELDPRRGASRRRSPTPSWPSVTPPTPRRSRRCGRR